MHGGLRLIVVVAALVVASKLLFENILGLPLEPLARSWLDAPGPSGALAIIGLLAADVVLPIPSSLVMILSGALFGVYRGALFAFIGSVGGEWLGFELVRRYGRRAAAAIAGDGDLTRMERLFARHGVALVIVTRALPIVMETTSVVAGLSAMSRRTFLLASAIGTLPIVVVYAYAGTLSRETGSVLSAIIILVAIAGAAWIWYRARTPAA